MEMAEAFEEAISLGTSVAGTHLVDLMPSRNISQCLESVQELILLSGIATSGAFRVQTKSAVPHLRECAHNLLNNLYEMKQQDMASHCLAMEKSLFTSNTGEQCVLGSPHVPPSCRTK